jgi:hypothetical protein
MLKRILTGLFMSVMLIFLLVVVLAKIPLQSQDAEPNVFCAYDRLFVEFRNGRNTWGTILLDDEGLPVPCDSEAKKRQESFKSKKYYGT